MFIPSDIFLALTEFNSHFAINNGMLLYNITLLQIILTITQMTFWFHHVTTTLKTFYHHLTVMQYKTFATNIVWWQISYHQPEHTDILLPKLHWKSREVHYHHESQCAKTIWHHILTDIVLPSTANLEKSSDTREKNRSFLDHAVILCINKNVIFLVSCMNNIVFYPSDILLTCTI